MIAWFVGRASDKIYLVVGTSLPHQRCLREGQQVATERSNFAGGSSDPDNGALSGANTSLLNTPGAGLQMIGYSSSENGASDNAVVTSTDPLTGASDFGGPIESGIGAGAGSADQASIALPDPLYRAAPGQFDPGPVKTGQGETTVAIPGNFAGDSPALVGFIDFVPSPPSPPYASPNSILALFNEPLLNGALQTTFTNPSSATEGALAASGAPVASPGLVFNEMPIGMGDSSSAPANADASAPVSAGSSSQTVTYQGSGLVFVNTYGAGVSAAYQNAIIAAENFYQSHITTSETLYFNFDTASGGFVGENQFYWITNVPYATLKSALAGHATSADDQAAVASLPASDPSGGHGFNITVDLAQALGLTNVNLQQYAGTVDLNSSLAYFYNQQSPVAGQYDAVSTLEHEISEGMGRIGGAGENFYSLTDLFRYSSPGVHSITGGPTSEYFSVDGNTLLLRYNNPKNVSGDAADWNPSNAGQQVTAVPGFPNNYDSFGAAPSGEVGLVSVADLRLMDIIGWNGVVTPPPVVTAHDQSVPYNQSISLSPAVFSVSGTGITQYQLWFSDPANGFPADGVVTDSHGAIATSTTITEASLSGVQFTGGAATGTDEIWLRAFNGQWSGWTLATLTDPGVTTPTVTPHNQTVAAGQSVALSTIFTVSGPAATAYQVYLAGPNDGSVTDANGQIATNTVVDEASLSGVNFVGGMSSGSDQLWMRAFDGQWSAWAPSQATLTDLGPSAAHSAQGSNDSPVLIGAADHIFSGVFSTSVDTVVGFGDGPSDRTQLTTDTAAEGFARSGSDSGKDALAAFNNSSANLVGGLIHIGSGIFA